MFRWFLLFTLVFGRLSAQETSRAINSTGLWSKYNLIVKPTVVTSPNVKTSTSTTTASSVIESKYATIEIQDDEESEEAEESDEDEEEEEEEHEGEHDDYEQQELQESEVQVQKYPHNKISGHKIRPHRPIVHVVQESPSTTQRSHKIHQSLKRAKKKGKKHVKVKGLKKLKKYMLPLLLAYKLKFFTLVPLLLGGLVLMVATTGFAGFFFALFAVGVGLKKD